jgi:hypothetical protein
MRKDGGVGCDVGDVGGDGSRASFGGNGSRGGGVRNRGGGRGGGQSGRRGGGLALAAAVEAPTEAGRTWEVGDGAGAEGGPLTCHTMTGEAVSSWGEATTIRSSSRGGGEMTEVGPEATIILETTPALDEAAGTISWSHVFFLNSFNTWFLYFSFFLICNRFS